MALVDGAQGRDRTGTPLQEQIFETCASTNSATWASGSENLADLGRFVNDLERSPDPPAGRTLQRGTEHWAALKLNRSEVSTLRLWPTLIVGLGGYGGKVLQALWQHLIEFYGRSLELPPLGLLWLDLEPSRGQGEHDPILRFPLSAGEGLDGRVHSWLYPGWAAWGASANQRARTRPAGRELFFASYPRLRAQLQEMLARLRDPENATRLLEQRLLRERERIPQLQLQGATRVYVLADASSSLSGMLMDLGFLLRELSPDGATARTLCLGLAEEAPNALGYATLKEVNHYLQPDHGFAAEWEVGKWVRPSVPAYEACLLQSLEVEPLAAYLSQEWTAPEIGELSRSLRLNIQAGSGSQGRLEQSFSLLFRRLSMARVAFPHRAVQRACARRLASDCLLHLAQGEAPRSPLEWFAEERLTWKYWFSRLVELPGDPLSMLGHIERWNREARAALRVGKRQQLQRILQEGVRWQEEELMTCFSDNAEALFLAERERLREMGWRALQSQNWSLQSLFGQLTELAARLTRWAESHRRQMSALADSQREWTGRVARQLAELTRWEKRPNWDGRASILLRVQQERILDMHLGTLEQPGLMLVLLLQQFHQQAAQLSRRLSGWIVQEWHPELQLMYQQAVDVSGDLRAQITDSAVTRSLPPCWNLCNAEVLWHELYPRYVGPQQPGQTLQEWLKHGGWQLGEALVETQAIEALIETALPLFGRIPVDASIFQQLPALELLVPEVTREARVATQATPEAHQLCLWAFPGVAAQSSPLERAHLDRNREQLVNRLQKSSPGLTASLCELSHGEELVLICESLALPVYKLWTLAPWRDEYVRATMLGEPLHLQSQDEMFSDLLPLQPEEQGWQRESEEAFLMGSMLGLLEVREGEWFWEESTAWGRVVHPLGEAHRLRLLLSRAHRLRGRLLLACRQALDGRLRGPDPQALLQLLGRVAQEKRQLWDLHHENLEILRGLEERIQASPTFLAHRDFFARELRDPELVALVPGTSATPHLA